MYFTKIEFQEKSSDICTFLSLNLVTKEIAYNVIKFTFTGAGGIQKMQAIKINDSVFSAETASRATYVASDKTAFIPELLITEERKEEILFSYKKEFSETQLKKLLPYCKVSDFEAYRNKAFSISDQGAVAYRDEVSLIFRGTSDSPVPYIEIPMNIIYDDNHSLPAEKLYEYILSTFFIKNKEVRRWLCR